MALEFQGGKYVGSILPRTGPNFAVRLGEHPLGSYSATEFGGPARARQVAEEIRVRYCEDHDKIRNKIAIQDDANGQRLFYVKLTKGQIMTVDDMDLEAVLEKTWAATHQGGKTYYAVAYDKATKRNVYFHKYVTGNPVTDHFDGNGLNNRRANLRSVSKAENNRRLRRTVRNKTGVVGVQKDKKISFTLRN